MTHKLIKIDFQITNLLMLYKCLCYCSAAAIFLGINGANATEQPIPLVRLPSNTLLKYTAYKDVSILHFRVPPDTRKAFFSFKSIEENKGSFQRDCTPKDVTLHLKAGSYPVVSPEDIIFPQHFLDADQRFKIYSLQFKSDGTTNLLNIDEPHSGNWFAIAFITWTDPNNDRIEQQGLAASCDTLLHSEMSVIRTTPIILNEDTYHRNTLHSNSTEPINYKFFVPKNVDNVTIKLSIHTVCLDCAHISVFVQADELPNTESYIQSAVLTTNQTVDDFEIEFYPQEDSWHYVDVYFVVDEDSVKNESSELNYTAQSALPQVEFSIRIELKIIETADNESSSSVMPQRNIEFYPLLRQTFREFFMYDYDLLPDANGTSPAFVNVSSAKPVGFEFAVGDVYDIGGTLSFAVAIVDVIKEGLLDKATKSDVAVAAKLIDRKISAAVSADVVKQDKQFNKTLIICMRLEEPGIPTWPDSCTYGRTTLPAASVINNTNDEASTGLVHVPFPETGKWYVTMGLFCQVNKPATAQTVIGSLKLFLKNNVKYIEKIEPTCTMCYNHREQYRNCILDNDCLLKLNETETLKIKECLLDPKCLSKKYQEMATKFKNHNKIAMAPQDSLEENLEFTECDTSTLFTISSSPCVAGRCGRYGRCYHYMSGGFVFSTCLCIKGYRGWDCSEDSQVPSSFSILLALLLLTLSNLLFIPSIYFGIRRKYYTESVIYFFAMFFSIFYHACDSGEDEYSFCLVKIGVLQFCDFYCGLLAIWVTLIAMAHIRQTLVSLFHMFGAILLAFGTELNKQSLWVFLAPALTGLCIISVSWSWRCRRTRKWFPARKYLSVFMPIGMVLVMVGLVCYAFLQTRQNYHIVHSIWHMVMALSILCLLPSRKSFLPKC